MVHSSPTTPTQDNADPEPAADTATLQASAGSANNTQISIADRQLSELLAGSKRRKAKGVKNHGSSKNSSKRNEKVNKLQTNSNENGSQNASKKNVIASKDNKVNPLQSFDNPIVLNAIAEVLESKKKSNNQTN